MSVTSRMEELRNDVIELAQSTPSSSELMQRLCRLLHERMLKYNWVGFYMIEPEAEPPMLALRAFVGAMTPHTRIPLNQGICGAAASSGRTSPTPDDIVVAWLASTAFPVCIRTQPMGAE